MSCEEVCRWIDALLDGELDPKNAAEVQGHLATCAACRRKYEAKQAVSANMRRLDLAHAAPESLRRRITEALEVAASQDVAAAGGVPVHRDAQQARVSWEEPAVRHVPAAGDARDTRAPGEEPAVRRVPAARPTRGPARWFMLAGWPVALAASALLATVLLQQRSQEAGDIVAAHVRSLLVDHLNDVVSTSHHTVKPWFAGKIDFSPPVPDLTSLGFELVGGRLDYVDHQPVAAVVYRKHGHIINVMASLPGRDTVSLPHTARVQGYSLRSWRQAGLNLVAVSDIDPLELANLEQGYSMPPPPAPEPEPEPEPEPARGR